MSWSVQRVWLPVRGSGTLCSVTAPPSHTTRSSAACCSEARSTVTTTSVRIARSSCLRSRSLVVGASNTLRRSAPACRHQAISSSVSGSGRSGGDLGDGALGAADLGEALFPFALQRAGDEPVLGLAGVELAAGALGVDLRALELQLGRAHPRLVVGVGVLDRAQRRLDPGRSQRLEHGVEHDLLDPPAADRLAALGAVELVAAHARVVGHERLAAVADLHPPPAAPAADQPLQQRPALARGAAALAARRAPVGAQPLLVGQVALEGDVAGVVVLDAHVPLLARRAALALADHAVLDAPLGALAPVGVRARVDGVGEDLVDRLVGRRRPAHPPVAGRPARQLAVLLEQPQHHLPGARELVEVREHGRDRVGDRLVRGDPDPPGLVVLKAGGQRQPQLALARLVQAAAAQPGAQHVQLGLAHRALQPEHEPVVVQPRVIDPVGVGDQRVGQRAQIQQPVPVGVAPRQPRDLDPEHDPDPPEPDLGDQPLEAVAPVGALGRPALVLVDHDHLRGVPAERDRPLDQLVLALAALGVALDLRHRRLAHIHVRLALQVLTLDLAHRCSSSLAEDARDRPRQQPQDPLLRRGRERLPHPIDPAGPLHRQGKLTRDVDCKSAHEGSPPRVVGASREASLRAAAVAARRARRQQPPQPTHPLGRQQRPRRRLARRRPRARRLTPRPSPASRPAGARSGTAPRRTRRRPSTASRAPHNG